MKNLASLLLLLLSTSTLLAQENDLTTSMERGENLYKKNCAVCHSRKGSGKGKRIPPLAQSDYLMGNRAASIKAVKYGLKGKITVNGVDYNKEMKAVELSDSEVADIMNYVMNTWGNQSNKMVTETEVLAIQRD